MAQLLPLLTALVLCSYGPVGALGCDLPHNFAPLSRTTLVLLGQMRRVSPIMCLKDRRDFRFPREVVNGSQFQKTQTVSVLHEMLQQVFNLFHTARSSAAWNNTLLEELHTALHQQLQGLETCLVQAMAEGDSVLTADSPTLMLKRYFQRIRLPGREETQWLCLGTRQNGNQESLLLNSRLAGKLKKQGWRPASS